MAGGMLQFPGQVHYAATAAEVEAVAQQVRAALPCPATIGIDFEWWFLGCEKGPIATVQLCWEEGGELHAAVLQVAQLAPWEQAAERMTPSLRELLQDANVRKVRRLPPPAACSLQPYELQAAGATPMHQAATPNPELQLQAPDPSWLPLPSAQLSLCLRRR